ncbi:FecR family protein [Hymenobacter caeli]|uniref:Ferric-dicitrate binding protein FerR (Iron transport regulator) n=1 Tax=Hymenobacter caeli TaxID=2735894 RepID=A0ABX2FMX6_9BACT|nr:FecR family protein [Hymenobacter caeli]NRT18371.1 ferric-dicitrate binding protein FerR (iron transport regulator) [Hymenobacter caeli]
MPPTELQALLHRYREGTCTPAEMRAVEAWYAAQPDGPAPALSADGREALRRALWQQLRPARRLSSWPPAAWQWLAAAAVAAGLGVGSRWLGAPAAGPKAPRAAAPAAARPWLVRQNATAGALAVRLPDGSRATLRPASQLRYRPGFAGGRRTVYLVGEAFFQVAHDAARPFQVYTADVVTRVLGTSFTVRAYPAQAETVVQVRTGQVRVSPLRPAAGGATAAAVPGPILLLPNQQAVYAPARQQLHRELVAQPVLLAPQPFAFDNRPVAEVLEALKTAYGVDIRYSPAAVAGCTVNLNLRRQASLFAKLDVLCQATGATYSQADAQITFHSTGCQAI